MAQLPQCIFVPTEVQHDFIKKRPDTIPIPRNIQISDNFRDMLSASHICQKFPHLIRKNAKPNNFFNDDEIVKYVFNDKKKSQLDQPTGKYNIPVKTIDGDDTPIDYNTMNIKPDADMSSINEIFGGGGDPIFLVIDVDSTGAIDKIIENASAAVNIHILHNVSTIADMATKPYPNAPKWAQPSSKGAKITSWFFNSQLEIPANDPLFMSNYSVTTFAQNPIGGQGYTPDWKTTQTWKLPGSDPQHSFNVFDCREMNNVKNNSIRYDLLKEVKTLAANRTKNECFQRKRSGDYFQIWFAKNFPERKVTDESGIWANDKFETRGKNYARDYFVFPEPPEPPADETGLTPEQDTERKKNWKIQWYRDRTYFMSGDWPATSYAVFNKVNTYFGLANKFIARVKFPQLPQ